MHIRLLVFGAKNSKCFAEQSLFAKKSCICLVKTLNSSIDRENVGHIIWNLVILNREF